MAVVRSTVSETIATLNDQLARLDGGDLEIHPGALPTDGDTAVNASGALVTFTLGNPAFASAVDVVDAARAAANPIADAVATATGTAGFALFRDSGGTQRHLADVSLDTGTGFVQLDDLAITNGETISVTTGAWRLSQNG